MKIQDRYVVCFKVLVTKNIFYCVLLNTETGNYRQFEISEKVGNDESENRSTLLKLKRCFSFKKFVFCGYNNNHYDNLFINCIFDSYDMFIEYPDYRLICDRLWSIHESVMKKDDDEWKKYKYGKNFSSFDLMMMNFSKRERISLQEVKFSLQLDNISSNINITDSNQLINNTLNDTLAIEELLDYSKDLINLRVQINEQYNIGTLSLDTVSLGRKIFEKLYKERLKESITKEEKANKIINFNDIILPFISFKSEQLKKILEEIKSVQLYTERPEFEKRFIYNNSKISMGLGGIHSIQDTEEIKVPKGKSLIHIDVESLYPTFVSQYGMFPEFLGKEFPETYGAILSERLEAKHNNNKTKDALYKRLLVAMVGMFNNPSDIFYDPETFYTITINGQLVLLMFAEQLINATDCRIVNWNTDGLFLLIDDDKLPEYNNTVYNFRMLTRFSFKETYIDYMCQLDGNNYFYAKKGFLELPIVKQLNCMDTEVVCKGFFNYRYKLGKAQNSIIIPKAIIYKLLFDTEVQRTVSLCEDVMAFMLYSKVDANSFVFFNQDKIGNVNRYYYSLNGGYINKGTYDLGKLSLTPITNTKYCVQLFNTIKDIKDINKNYYIGQANVILSKIRNNQLTLF